MPKRNDIKSILIIGAGPIIIGQACEFDYSGVQACKALREEGYRVILVNSNPATIMTDPDMADATYIEPITPEMVTKIIEKERPDALLPTMGGQTALNCALALNDQGVLEKFGVEMIGAKPDAIDKAENRQRFNDAMAKIGLEVPRNEVVDNLEDAKAFMKKSGLPAIIRPSFTLGGTGGGVAYTEDEFEEIVLSGLDASPTNQVLIDESLLGWKEYEMEVVRDKNDNCIIICSIENVDPMGVHTGDSITVAPALTLTDKEYQIMRDASCAVLREIGVETGGSNVQFGVDPKTGRVVVIEMNPRVSRSSALASKATGFPIAKVAAKLAVGYTLDELANDIVAGKDKEKGGTFMPASFEPTIDYVVTKIPRFTFEKFSKTKPILTSAMKSVGEAMSIGGTFQESLQKALRSLETGLTGLNDKSEKNLEEELKLLTPKRILLIAQAFREGWSMEKVQATTSWDLWFLEQIQGIVQAEEAVKASSLDAMSAEDMLALKQMGFADARLAQLMNVNEKQVRDVRHKMQLRPVYKRVDTCAAEFEAHTPYMYSTYWGTEIGEKNPLANEAQPSNRSKVMILGGGPNRIGQGIEFDYTCVHAAFSMRGKHETIMVNCNPETVSTDYDTSDRLYFEPLTLEDVLEIVHVEESNGNLVGLNIQFGGQTPLKLASGLESENVPLIGTSPKSIDLAEDREHFKALLERLELRQPENAISKNRETTIADAAAIGYPVVVRPSFVLGGRAMAIVNNEAGLHKYLEEFPECLDGGPLLLDRFLRNATEVDVDCLCDGEEVFVSGIMEHIEEAGVHSGDSACTIPPHSLPKHVVDNIKEQSRKLAIELQVKGLMNVQYAVKGEDIYILEVNPRASRTVPFVAKATGIPVAKIASLVMAGDALIPTLKETVSADILAGVADAEVIAKLEAHNDTLPHMAVKEVVFPFARFSDTDVVLGPEMKSTGEVMGIDQDFATAVAKAQLGTGFKFPKKGTVFISVKDDDKNAMISVAKDLLAMGFSILSTHGTAKFLREQGVEVEGINKVLEGSPHIVDRIQEGGVQLVINTTEGEKSLKDSFSIRRTTLLTKTSYTTTATGAAAIVKAMGRVIEGEREGGEPIAVKSLQEYF